MKKKIKLEGYVRTWDAGLYDWSIQEKYPEKFFVRIASSPLTKYWKTKSGARRAMLRAAEQLGIDVEVVE